MSEIIWLDENETEPRKQNFATRQLLERVPVIEDDITAIQASIAGIPAGTTTPVAPQGRLTLVTATPVMTTTHSAKTTIYYTPYVGTLVPIWDGAAMIMTAFTELSVATSDTTKSPAAIGASKVNDWFVWNDGGTMRLGHGPDWTTDTTRSAGTALTRSNGIWLNNASITNGPAASRGTYVGTTRSNGSSQLDWIYGGVSSGGTAGFLGVWNAYNRVDVASFCGDSTDTWTYNTVAWRQANNSATIRTSFVAGLIEDVVTAQYNGIGAGSTTSRATVGVGFNVTNAFTGSAAQNGSVGAAVPCLGRCAVVPAFGFNFISAIEFTDVSSDPITFVGDLGSSTSFQSGLFVSFRM